MSRKPPRNKPVCQRLPFLLERQQGKCGICRGHLEASDANVDHIVPRAIGGCNEIWNLRATHKSCNTSRGAAPENSAEYRDALERHRLAGRLLTGAYYHDRRYDAPMTTPQSERAA